MTKADDQRQLRGEVLRSGGMNSDANGLCRHADSVLVVVDIQERLAAAMPEESRENIYKNTEILLKSAALLGVPALLTEQYPSGLGPTVERVAASAASAIRFEKTCFSCSGAEGFVAAVLATGRRQLVLAGMEAHVCVLQTALDAHSEGYEVILVEDAVCSRSARNHRNAVERARQFGVTVAVTESVVFEWLRDAGHEHFRAISRLVR